MEGGEEILNLTHLDPCPSHWKWTRIHPYWNMICQVESNSWLPLWDDNIPLLMRKSNFCKTTLVLVHLTSHLDSDWYLNLACTWEICYILRLGILLASSWLWTSHLGQRLGTLTWWDIPHCLHACYKSLWGVTFSTLAAWVQLALPQGQRR